MAQLGLTPREVIDRLSQRYGVPEWRPHGDPVSELVLVVLSQHTSDSNSGRAFARLKEAFPAWKDVITADTAAIEEAIRVGGLARSKAPRIKALLAEVQRRTSDFDLSFLKEMPLDEAKLWLRSLPGIGPKSAACVLMFALGRPALPVDTHVFRVSQRLGFLPARIAPEQAHDQLEAMLDADEVYPFHISLIRHGRGLCQAQRPACHACPLLSDCPAASAPDGTAG